MSDEPSLIDAVQASLAELAELDLAAVRHAHAVLVATTDPAEVANLARAYAAVSRGVRQTLALRLKAAQPQPQPRPPAEPAAPRPPFDDLAHQRRRRDLTAAVTRVIWQEAEDDADWGEYMTDVATERLRHASLRPGFPDRPLHDHVLQACAELRLDPDLAAAWQDLPDPRYEDEEDPIEPAAPPDPAVAAAPEPRPPDPPPDPPPRPDLMPWERGIRDYPPRWG